MSKHERKVSAPTDQMAVGGVWGELVSTASSLIYRESTGKFFYIYVSRDETSAGNHERFRSRSGRQDGAPCLPSAPVTRQLAPFANELEVTNSEEGSSVPR